MAPAPSTLTELKAPGQPIYAWVEVDGVKAEIYSENKEGKVVSGYIESKVGSRWVLGYRLGTTKPKHDISARAYVDGSGYDGHAHSVTEPCFSAKADSVKRKNIFAGTPISKTEEKTLEFTPIEYTEDAKLALNNQAILQGLGSIRLEFNYGKVTGEEHDSVVKTSGLIDQTPVYQGMKEELDLSERTKLGRTVTSAEPDVGLTFENINGGKALVCEFKFYYRNREILERRGHIKSIKRESDDKKPIIYVPAPSSSLSGKRTSDVSLDDEILSRIKKIRREQEELEQLCASRSSTPQAASSSNPAI